MARQKGVIKLKGKIGDLSFYQSRDGNLVREKGGVDGTRIANDPAFARTRENGAEFGSSATSGKLVRDAVRTLMMSASDGRVTARLTKLMTSIKNLDVTSARGERTVGTAIALPAAKARLKGFNFNNRAILGSVLYKPYTVDTSTGEINITDLAPMNDVAFPRGATHLTLRGGWAKIDFTTNEQTIEFTNSVNLPIDGTLSTVDLIPTAVPAGAGVDVFLLMIEFTQEVNAIQYSLKNGAFNALCIVDVA
jgi:hypothetical protein